jgi:glucose/arabinose dehydrogenase
MRKISFWVSLFVFSIASTDAVAASGYSFVNAFSGITFTNPVVITSPPGETNRLFVVEKRGRIVVITNLAAPNRSIFMDITDRVQASGDDTSVGDEEGLLGLAFHPGYATNGFFYVFYTGPGLFDILSRFSVSGSDPDQGDTTSEVRYIVQSDAANNHNAGDLHFGPDGYLYVALGDEGGGYDSSHNSQKITNDFFSAILRLDVDKKAGSAAPNPHPALPALTNYTIPPSNPFVGATDFNGFPILDTTKIRTEFWAVGMRNPHRFSFDPQTGLLYLGHVGQDQIEWVNLVSAGANCGWNFYEGSKNWTNSLPPGFVFNPPLAEYGHTNSRRCVIGGVVYRGSRIPQLYGAYLYADYVSGELWTLRHSGFTVTQSIIVLTNTSARLTSFGVDPSNGDVLCAAARGGNNSTIERLVNNSPIPPSISQATRSGTNLILGGTNGPPGQPFSLVVSTNVILPASDWAPVATGVFDSSGSFLSTNPISPTLSQRFFRLRLP